MSIIDLHLCGDLTSTDQIQNIGWKPSAMFVNQIGSNLSYTTQALQPEINTFNR